jgi:hypothetical protein
MKKKFAVCFSGYPRFVKKQFENIKTNFLDGLGDYDIYALFQWPEDWKNALMHSEYDDTFETNEVDDFVEVYGSLNLKKIVTISPYDFSHLEFNGGNAEPDLSGVSEEILRDIFYRQKCQFQGIEDCIKLIDNPFEYDFIVRLRTDLIFLSEIILKDLDSDVILNQDQFCAGANRPYSDWFFIAPTDKLNFFTELSKIEIIFENGVIGHHRFVGEVGSKYGIEHHEFNVRTPTTVGPQSTLFKKPTSNYNIIKKY